MLTTGGPEVDVTAVVVEDAVTVDVAKADSDKVCDKVVVVVGATFDLGDDVVVVTSGTDSFATLDDEDDVIAETAASSDAELVVSLDSGATLTDAEGSASKDIGAVAGDGTSSGDEATKGKKSS